MLFKSKTVRTRTLFVHVPKTGGTTLDNILSGHFDHTAVLRNLSGFSGQKLLQAKNDKSLRYVSGHVPSSIFDLTEFTHKVTVIRDPREIIASARSFSNEFGYDYPGLNMAINNGIKLDIYPLYFCGNFDLNRMLLDYEYGVLDDANNYVSKEKDIDSAISRLKQFNWIVDFADISDMAKTMIVELGNFPLRKIEHKRRSKSQADLLLGDRLVSDFDREFYVRARDSFSKPRVRQIGYDSYRQAYARHSGVDLAPWADIRYDLNNPVGQMWHLPEISELGKCYRWSECSDVTIEIPIKHSGVYEIYFYFRNTNTVRIVNLRPDFEECVKLVSQEFISNDALVISKNFIKVCSSGWADFSVEMDIADNPTQIGDDRDIGIALGAIYIRRLND